MKRRTNELHHILFVVRRNRADTRYWNNYCSGDHIRDKEGQAMILLTCVLFILGALLVIWAMPRILGKDDE